MSSNLTKPRFLVSYFHAASNSFAQYASDDLERALSFYTAATESDPAALFLKVNSTGYVRRIYYPEQLRLLKLNDDQFRDGWREYTGRVTSQAAEAAINEIERQVESPQDDWLENYPRTPAPKSEGELLQEETPGLKAHDMAPERECEYCSGSGCQFCHFGKG